MHLQWLVAHLRWLVEYLPLEKLWQLMCLRVFDGGRLVIGVFTGVGGVSLLIGIASTPA